MSIDKFIHPAFAVRGGVRIKALVDKGVSGEALYREAARIVEEQRAANLDYMNGRTVFIDTE